MGGLWVRAHRLIDFSSGWFVGGSTRWGGGGGEGGGLLGGGLLWTCGGGFGFVGVFGSIGNIHW